MLYKTSEFQKYYLVCNLSKPVLRMLYHDITGDASLANDQMSKETEERLRLMMLLEPSIIIDLRTISGFQGSKFDILWDELDGYFNKHNNTVVNELRTDATLSISIRGLRDRIITRLNKGPPLPSDIFIPSEDWIRSNFHHPTPLPRLCSTLGVLM
ncbi:hypothetical protein RhiirA5_422210 [Rhizophagus irregularis]|uniref:Uncharacterized protein n=3 Tax=Rhizophagus irregularis TaxID=588596 RepID=A0A2I1EPM7_9GLOM|nr:hypothetical protein RirG_202690 [Rhizophagus irregularis DAOM 197198w]PKC04471.1 hypothetical protein RhiirA5_422210 [Rhizophagus irregularis]PKC56485.1 hypothetical protein RhiirA1_542071 [Rhizophagus irregularis]PKY24076.1 hypothetical protein RhiirB3_438504 [Rhizophagus irregularis]CAB5195116.1 unnamed protein product [Rhizophagus irregularis]